MLAVLQTACTCYLMARNTNQRGEKMYSLLPNTKLFKQHKKLAIICDRIEQIKDEYTNGEDLSWEELVFLQENQSIIKKVYTDDIILWELAGIPEEEWKNR